MLREGHGLVAYNPDFVSALIRDNHDELMKRVLLLIGCVIVRVSFD